MIFDRSHYEDVLVVRVHKLAPRAVWSKRYDLINDFEKMLEQNGTRILKFFLHISPEEQLARFKQRLDDPSRNWKISESDYAERELWPQYVEAYEEALARTSTKHAPWHVIPANHKWFRNLAVSQNRRRHNGRDGAEAAANPRGPRGDTAQVPRGGRRAACRRKPRVGGIIARREIRRLGSTPTTGASPRREANADGSASFETGFAAIVEVGTS